MKNQFIKTAAGGALLASVFMIADGEAANVASGYDQDAALKAGVCY
jgi:hypothetical protein